MPALAALAAAQLALRDGRPDPERSRRRDGGPRDEVRPAHGAARDARRPGSACCSSSPASRSASRRSSRCARSSRACARVMTGEARTLIGGDVLITTGRRVDRVGSRRARCARWRPSRLSAARTDADRDRDDGAAGGRAEAGRADGGTARRRGRVPALRRRCACATVSATATRCSSSMACSCGPSC